MAVNAKKKTKLILAISIVVALIIVGVGTYFIWSSAKQEPVRPVSDISLDQTPSYGACQLVTSNTIKQTFGGEHIVQINEGVRIGEKEMNDTIGEGCQFTFSTRQSNTNSLTASIYEYTASDKEAIGDGWSEVGGSTPIAYFGEAKEDDGKVTVYMYRILPGNKNILITLRQPTSALTYDKEGSFNFIGGIASKVNLSVIQDKATEDSNPEPGAVTDTP